MRGQEIIEHPECRGAAQTIFLAWHKGEIRPPRSTAEPHRKMPRNNELSPITVFDHRACQALREGALEDTPRISWHVDHGNRRQLHDPIATGRRRTSKRRQYRIEK